MMKEKLFRWLFPGYAKNIDMLETKLAIAEIEHNKRKQEATLADLMRDSLGLPMIDFSNVDDTEATPPHFLQGLSEEGRKNYVAHLESIYTDPKFQEVYAYTINLIGNHVVRKVPDPLVGNGRMGIVGLKIFMKEFEKAHEEHIDSKKVPETFDPLEPIPQV